MLDGMEIIIAAVSAIIALGAFTASFIFGRRQTLAAEDSARSANQSLQTAERTLANAERARRDALFPYIWADIRGRDDGGVLELVVGNSGPTVAEHVRIELEPALAEWAPEDETENVTRLTALLRKGLSSIPPGRQFHWSLGTPYAYFPNEGEEPVPLVKVSLNAHALGEPMPEFAYFIDMEDLKHQSARPTGFAILEQPIKAMSKSLATLASKIQ